MPDGYTSINAISTVLFDFDDTLVNSWNARVYALQSIFTHFGISGYDVELFLRESLGTPLNEALAQLAAQQKLDSDELFQLYRHYYWAKQPGLLDFYPGVREMLEGLHSRGVKLGIVTLKARSLEISGRQGGAIKELEELEANHLFQVIVGFEDVRHFKPHPEGVHIALESLASIPRETLVVGDSRSDIEAGRAAGCRSCYATWGVHPDSTQLNDIPADFVIARPQELLTLPLCPISGKK